MPVLKLKYNDEPLKPGEYKVRIKSCEEKTSQKGKAYLNWMFETQDGRTLYYTTPTGGAVLQGLVYAAIPDFAADDIDTDALIGNEIMVTCEKGYKQDGTESKYPKVVDVRPANFETESDLPF